MASTNSTKQGKSRSGQQGPGQHRTKIVELERQLGKLKRQLMAAHEQQLKRAERHCQQVQERVRKLREQSQQAQDTVRVAREEARLKANLPAERQLQRARTRAAQLKEALATARASQAEARQELARRRANVREEQRVARATGQAGDSRGASTRSALKPAPKARKPSSSSANSGAAASAGNVAKKAIAARSVSKPKPAATPRHAEANPPGDSEAAPSAPPSPLEPAGGEALVNQVRRDVARDLRKKRTNQPAASIVKMNTRVAETNDDTDSRSTAPRPEPVMVPPALQPAPQPPDSQGDGADDVVDDSSNSNPSTAMRDNGGSEPNHDFQGPGADGSGHHMHGDDPERSAPRHGSPGAPPPKSNAGPVRSLFDLLDE